LYFSDDGNIYFMMVLLIL